MSADRGPRRRLRVLALATAGGLGAVVGVGCAGSERTVAEAESRRVVPAEVVATIELGADASPSALAAFGDEKLAIGDRRTGRIVAVEVAAPDSLTDVADVKVDPAVKGQRGLLGLVSVDDALYASWTRAADGRLVVGQVSPGPERIIWMGPQSADLGNGGHLAVDDNGRMLIGIGDLEEPDRTDDPDAPNGKLLVLDPDGEADQQPEVLTGGWNNPFAFTVTGGDDVWVADNAPGDRPERLGRGDSDAPRLDLPGKRAPADVVSLGPGRLGLCGYLDGDLVEVDLTPSPTLGDTLLTSGCRTGAAVLGDGLLAVADEKVVRLVRLRGPGG